MDLNKITDVARPRHEKELPAWRAGDAWLAGGTWLFSEPQAELSRLIDLLSLGWQPLRTGADGLKIAATCTIAQLDALKTPVEWTATPLINQCCRAFLASFKIWNMATVGGNLCMALPAGPMISLASALDGVCTIWSGGSERHVPAVEFVTRPQQNVLKPGEMLRSILLPAAALSRRTAFRQCSLSRYGRSAALLIGTRSARKSDFTLTVTASTPRPVQLVFDTIPAGEVLRARIEREIPASSYFDDVHGSPAWRRHMTLHLAEEIRSELAVEVPR
jgi:CO/xanthine dehydrogenase FAD-binding subunit